MKDAEKQIEELTSIIDSFYIRTYANAKAVAKFLVEKYDYRKIPEGAVVITREEYESLIEQARKETAKVILKELIKNCQYTFNSVGKPIIALSGDFALNVSKQYGVDIGERNDEIQVD